MKKIGFLACLVLTMFSLLAADGEFRIEIKKGKAGIIYVQKEKNSTYNPERWILEPDYDSIKISAAFKVPYKYSKPYKDSAGRYFLLYKKGSIGLFRAAFSINANGAVNSRVIPNPQKKRILHLLPSRR